MADMNDPYDYNLGNIRGEIESKWRQQQDDEIKQREKNGVVGIGGGSWTSDINRFNAAKRDEYMKALESANNMRRADTQQSLAQRQQAFSEASNYANLARLEKERTENLEARKRQEAEQKRQFEAQHGLAQQQAQEQKESRVAAENFSREKFAYQQKRDEVADKDAAIVRNVQLKQAAINHKFESQRLSLDQFRAETDANMRQIEAATANQNLKQQAQAAAQSRNPDEVMEKLQAMIQGTQNISKDMNESGFQQQQLGMNLFNSLTGAQQQKYQQELSKYMDFRRLAHRTKEIGEERAYQEEMRKAAEKAASNGALANIMSNVLGTVAATVIK